MSIRPILMALASLWLVSCSPDYVPLPYEGCTLAADSSERHPKHARLEALLNQYSQAGLPGLSVAIYTPAGGLWQGAAGFANLEHGQPLAPCHLMATASIGKLYCAVAMLKLQERGLLNLDDALAKYLPTETVEAIVGSSSITLRHLLSHTAGLANIDFDLRFTCQILRDPHAIDRDLITQLIYSATPETTPGNFYYSSSGFEVLTQVMDQVAPEGHEAFYRSILDELGLTESYYRTESSPLQDARAAQQYLDRFDNGRLENITETNSLLTNALTGSDGMVASPLDNLKFLRAIMEGNYLTEESRSQLLAPTETGFSPKPYYGLGLWYRQTDYGLALGHDGGSIGAGADLWYFPEQQVYLFSATNVGIFFSDSQVNDTYRDRFLPKLIQIAME
ncbi:MAG: serine hydrolase domain-containing protein [Bacteroidota bacterium]